MVSVRKKTRNKQKEEAIKGASSAMFSSVGFFLNIRSEVKSVEESSLELKQSANNLTDLLLNYLDTDEPPPVPDAVPEDRMPEIAGRAKKQAFDLAKLGLLLPFLINKESRDYLAGFLSGLIGENALTAIKATLIGITGVLTGVFAYKLFKQIGTTFEAVKELSRVTSVLFGITSAANDELEVEKEKVGKDKKEVDKEKKKKAKEKKELDEKKRNAKSARDDLKKEKQALKGKSKLRKLFAFASRVAPNVGKKLLTAIPFVGTFAAVGLLLYEIYDEAINFFDDEEREPVKVDAVKEDDESDSSDSTEPVQAEPVEKPSVAAGVPPLVQQAGKQAPGVAPTGASSGTESSSSSQSAAPVQMQPPSIVQNAGEGMAESESESDEGQQAELQLPVFTMPKTLDIAETSEEVVIEKKDVVPTVVVNNIDTSTTITKTEQKTPMADSGYRYSTTVGM